MMVYFNNCNGREHERIFGSGAFYDLATIGYQATKATNLSVGQQCIVATLAKDGKIVFTWYKFLREVVKQDDEGNSCRAFFGNRIRSNTLSKADAARDGLYSAFFDKNGNFKRQSVIQR
jgi:hypothetical protein